MQSASGQAFLVVDTSRFLLNPGREGAPAQVLPFRLSVTADYSLTASLLSLVNDPGKTDRGQFILLHGLRYSWTIEKPDKLTFTNSLYHRLGFQFIFDSVTRIQADETLFRTKLEYKVFGSLSLAFDSDLSTRLLNGFDYSVDDSGHTVRALNSSFLTPFIWNVSFGLSYRIPKTGSIMAGLSGLRLTCIRDTSVFGEQKAMVYHGVPKGHDHLVEYGISCRFQADRTFWKIVRWNCDMMIFKGYNTAADLNLKNLFEIRPVGFLVISLLTRVYYEEDISRRVCTENILSAGFSLRK
jgi:hypothetical protein